MIQIKSQLILLAAALIGLPAVAIRTLAPTSQCKRAFGSLLVEYPRLGMEHQLTHSRMKASEEGQAAHHRRLQADSRRNGRRKGKQKVRASAADASQQQLPPPPYDMPPAVAARAGATPPLRKGEDAQRWHDAMHHFLHLVRPPRGAAAAARTSSSSSSGDRHAIAPSDKYRNDIWRRDGRFRSSLRQEEFAAVFHFAPLPAANTTLRVLNVGFGGTGTGTVFRKMLLQYRPACHREQCTSDRISNPLLEQYLVLLSCVRQQTVSGKQQQQERQKQQSQVDQCSTKAWMARTREALLSVAADGAVGLHSVPTGFFYRELMDLVPRLTIVHSLRDPYEWVMQRMMLQQGDLICKPNATFSFGSGGTSSGSGSGNMFHLLQCIQHSQRLSDNVMWMSDYLHLHEPDDAKKLMGAASVPHAVAVSMEAVANAYADYNQMLLLNTLREDNLYAPVCVWDGHVKEQLPP